MVVDKPVVRCVCADVTFEDVKKSGVASVEEAIDHLQVGLRCRACRPYLQRVIETGETAFAIIEDLQED